MKKLIFILVSTQLAFAPMVFADDNITNDNKLPADYTKSYKDMDRLEVFFNALQESQDLLGTQKLIIDINDGLPEKIRVVSKESGDTLKTINLKPFLDKENNLDMEVEFEEKEYNFKLSNLLLNFEKDKQELLDRFTSDEYLRVSGESVKNYQERLLGARAELMRKYMSNISIVTNQRIVLDSLSETGVGKELVSYSWGNDKNTNLIIQEKRHRINKKTALAVAISVGLFYLSSSNFEVYKSYSYTEGSWFIAEIMALEFLIGVVVLKYSAKYFKISSIIKNKSQAEYYLMKKILKSPKHMCKRFFKL